MNTNTKVTVRDLYELALGLLGFGPSQVLGCQNRCFVQAWDVSRTPGFEFAEENDAFAIAAFQESLCKQFIFGLASGIAMLDLNQRDIENPAYLVRRIAENLDKPVPPEVADAQPTKAPRKIG